MRHFGVFIFATCVATAVAQFGFDKPLGGLDSSAADSVKQAAEAFTQQFNQAAEAFTQQFNGFQNQFNKVYSSPEEEKKRLGIFGENQKFIDEWAKTGSSMILKANQFSDLFLDEFNKLVNGLKADRLSTHAEKPKLGTPPKLPENVDWREKGAVSPIKNQGTCASCYAFVTAATLEGYLANKNGKLEELSPQNVMDCTSYGCETGDLDDSFVYVKNNGINKEEAYPYQEKSGTECKFQKEQSEGSIQGHVLLDEGADKQLEQVLATKGPVAAGIDASHESWQHYGGGIYYEPQCSSSVDHLNHAILVIGYGKDANGQKYWLIKNTYGKTWGEDGYVRLARNVTNHCGITTYAMFPKV